MTDWKYSLLNKKIYFPLNIIEKVVDTDDDDDLIYKRRRPNRIESSPEGSSQEDEQCIILYFYPFCKFSWLIKYKK
jgi:hypothetical protein